MIETFAILLLIVAGLSLALHIFSLPGNWVVLALAILWKLTGDPGQLTWVFVMALTAPAGLGEIIEFLGQYYGGKRYGSTGRGNLGGIIGAIAGAILGAPFFLGLGAIIGALLGAWGGCLFFEMAHGRPYKEANRAALGAFWGKFFGMAAKLGIGMVMFVLLVGRVWPWG